MTHSYNSSIWEVVARRTQLEEQPELNNESYLSTKRQTKGESLSFKFTWKIFLTHVVQKNAQLKSKNNGFPLLNEAQILCYLGCFPDVWWNSDATGNHSQ